MMMESGSGKSLQFRDGCGFIGARGSGGNSAEAVNKINTRLVLVSVIMIICNLM